MTNIKHAATCKWAAQTLWLEPPLWLESWQYPWTCTRDTEARPLATTDECLTCSRWQRYGSAPPSDQRGA